MQKLDPVQIWLDNVYATKSRSQNTQNEYRGNMAQFLNYVKITAEEILGDYEKSQDREFKRKYSQMIKAWIGEMSRKGYAPNSIRSKVGAVQSFFKYNDLPLGFIPQAPECILYHNRDITREEIATILKASAPRNRAFYSVMVQSGLRPNTLCKLQIKHLEPDFSQGIIPCKIDIPQELNKGKYHAYFTFIGEEAAKHLRDYFSTRTLNTESYVFAKAGHEDQPCSPKAVSSEFNNLIRRLRTNKQLDFQVRSNKPSELRLYNLRKYFKKYASQMGSEESEFLMGHKLGLRDHYSAQDPEHYRKLYAEKAMPFLRIESATPTETEKTIDEQAQQIADLKTQNEQLEQKIRNIEKIVQENLAATARLRTLMKEADHMTTDIQAEARKIPKTDPARKIKKILEKEP